MEGERREEKKRSFLFKVEKTEPARVLPSTYRVADNPRHFISAASPQILFDER